MAGGVKAEQVLSAERAVRCHCLGLYQNASDKIISKQQELVAHNLEAGESRSKSQRLGTGGCSPEMCLLQDSLWERGQQAPSGAFIRALTIHEGVLPNYDLAPNPKAVLCFIVALFCAGDGTQASSSIQRQGTFPGSLLLGTIVAM